MTRFAAVILLLISFDLDAQTIQESFNRHLTGSGVAGADFFQNNKMNFYDVKHLKLDIVVQPKSTFIKASCNYTVLVSQPLDTFAIEFKQTMQLDSVYLNNAKTAFTQSDDHIYISLQPVVSAGTFLDVTFFYQGNVAAGFFSGTDANGLDYTASVSESFQSREWFPAKQFLNDKIDSTDTWITTGAASKSGSNGLLKEVIDLPNNLKQYRWSCHYPLSYYLVSVAVGNYLEYNNYAKPSAIAPDSILIQNHLVNDSNYFLQNKQLLDNTPRFIEKMSELFGIYPFYKEKYGHSQAAIGGGMENATMTTLQNFEPVLVAHELSHQWFGDNITCASWNDIWLNESFATYISYLMQEYLPAIFPKTAAQAMTDFHNTVLSAPGGSVYVPVSDSYNESRIFDYRLTYAKGATALHDLRFQMQSDTLFFNTLKKYQQQFKNAFATTQDFKSVAEQISGKNLDDFFNQRIYGEGHPTYNVTYLKHGNDTLVLQISQTTSAPSVTPLFKGLVEYTILSPQGDTTIQLNQTSVNQTFALYYNKTPSGVVVDPNDWILDGPGTIKEGVSTFPPPPDHITIAPNPLRHNLFIKIPPGVYNSIRLTDADGRILAHYTIGAAATSFQKNISLPAGVYFLQFTGSSKKDVRKILVTN